MEKRAHERVHKRVGVRFGEAALDRSGFTRDISANGAFVVCFALPPVGARLRLQFLMGPNQVVARTGVVRRLRQVPPPLRHVEQAGFGIAFVDEPASEPVAVPAPKPASAPVKTPATPVPAVGRLGVHFESAAALRARWDAELRVGGLLVRSDAPAALDQRVTVLLFLDFARRTLELPARVVQILEAPARSIAVALEDPKRLRQELAPFLA